MIDTDKLIKEAKAYYEIFSKPIKLRCPYCTYDTSHKTKTFRSLKSLSWHVMHEHQNEIGYPFSLEQVQELIKVIGIAIHWEILI